MEEENSALDNIPDFLSIDYERIKSMLDMKGSVDSPKNVLNVLSGVTRYLRDVVNRHKYIGQIIESKQKLIQLKEMCQIEAVQNLKTERNNIEIAKEQLLEKVDRIKNAQYNLFSRASDVSELVGNLEDEDIVNIHKMLCQNLGVMQNRVDTLQKKMDVFKERQNLVVSHVEFEKSKYQRNRIVLNGMQLDAIKSNCQYIGENINELVDDVISIEKELETL